jgi:hypothetical protein
VARDGGGARGGRGPGCVRGRDAGREGDGERPDERVPRAYRVDGAYPEAFDGLGAVRADQGAPCAPAVTTA